jgi:hypothetical protein
MLQNATEKMKRCGNKTAANASFEGDTEYENVTCQIRRALISDVSS